MSAGQIQQARDALAKWREEARAGEWSIEADTAESSWLGRGTAGNPDLLDALDAVLAAADVPAVPITVPVILLADRIAAAIIAADERMSA